jgi:hypothetical protein
MGMLRPPSWSMNPNRSMAITTRATHITLGPRSTIRNPGPTSRSISPRFTDTPNHIIRGQAIKRQHPGPSLPGNPLRSGLARCRQIPPRLRRMGRISQPHGLDRGREIMVGATEVIRIPEPTDVPAELFIEGKIKV